MSGIGFPTEQKALVYTQTTLTLTTAHINGSTPIVLFNPNRHAIFFNSPADFFVSMAANSTDGLPVYGTARDGWVGHECPSNALYLRAGGPLVAGNKIIIWEA